VLVTLLTIIVNHSAVSSFSKFSLWGIFQLPNEIERFLGK
jgi:hypothetical protein